MTSTVAEQSLVNDINAPVIPDTFNVLNEKLLTDKFMLNLPSGLEVIASVPLVSNTNRPIFCLKTNPDFFPYWTAQKGSTSQVNSPREMGARMAHVLTCPVFLVQGSDDETKPAVKILDKAYPCPPDLLKLNSRHVTGNLGVTVHISSTTVNSGKVRMESFSNLTRYLPIRKIANTGVARFGPYNKQGTRDNDNFRLPYWEFHESIEKCARAPSGIATADLSINRTAVLKPVMATPSMPIDMHMLYRTHGCFPDFPSDVTNNYRKRHVQKIQRLINAYYHINKVSGFAFYLEGDWDTISTTGSTIKFNIDFDWTNVKFSSVSFPAMSQLDPDSPTSLTDVYYADMTNSYVWSDSDTEFPGDIYQKWKK